MLTTLLAGPDAMMRSIAQHATYHGLCAVLVVAALGIPRASSAQDARVYVGAAGMLSTQGSHRQGTAPSLPTTGADGTVIGATVEGGGFLTSRIALGIEVSLPRRFTALQETDYSRVFQQESRHRDLALSGLLRETVVSAGRVRVGVVEGGGLIQESTQQRRRDQAGPLPTFPPVFGPFSDEYSFTRWTVAALAGADVEISIAPHVAVVPQVRVHFIKRSSDPTEQGWALGLSSVVLRPTIGVRAAF
jgi:hypothetical protein